MLRYKLLQLNRAMTAVLPVLLCSALLALFTFVLLRRLFRHHRTSPDSIRIFTLLSPKDTVGDLKKIIAAQTGTKPEKLRLQKWYTVYKDHITLEDYEINDGMGIELYYT